jgi:hypothetical protein
MVKRESTYNTWPATRQRMMMLETDILQWDRTTHTLYKTEDATLAKAQLSELVLESSMKELYELRELLAFWEERTGGEKLSVPVHIGAIAAAIYTALMLAIVIYLLALAR